MWECAIKSSLGKLEIPEDFFSLIPDAGYEVLAITIPHLEGFRALPIHHRDPFDRMLIAQAQVDGAVLMTRDAEITKYDVKTIAC